MRGALVALAVLLAGCSSPAGDASDRGESPAPAEPVALDERAEDPWAGRDRILVAHQQWTPDTFALDVLCVFGGEWYVPRTGEPVLPGTTHFDVTVEVGATETGLQIGLQYKDDETLWLEPVANERRTLRLDIPAEQAEASGEEDWTFWYRSIVADDPEVCYTGLSLGLRTVDIEAVRGRPAFL